MKYLINISIFIGIIVGIIVCATFLVGSLSYITVKRACTVWERETGRETKFVSSYPLYADCYTKTESGWISATKINQVETPNLTD